MAKTHARLDWLRRLECTTQVAPNGPLRMGEIEVRDNRSGATYKGIAAVRKVAWQIPAYWPLLPLLYLPAVARRIDPMSRGCGDGGCELPGSAPSEETATR